MKLNVMSDVKAIDDARLVQLGRNGNRDAFGHLVSRYQSPVCALAYSACGNLAQSQDLAQETFIIAWQKLGDLKEPAKFKSWLFGIVRNLINNSIRQGTRNPLTTAEPLDESVPVTAVAVGSNPAGHTISKEEEGILWRSLEQIPGTYREPLILFYREHQSIETVAATLELSEENVRQRLSRGRKLLQDQVTAFVEGALAQTVPGQAFTLGVLAALPVATISTKAATLGAAAKGGAMVKAAGLAGFWGALLTPLLAFLGMVLQYRWLRQFANSAREVKLYRIFCFGIFLSVVVFIGIVSLMQSWSGALIKSHPAWFAALQIGVILVYFLIINRFSRWFFRSLKKITSEQPPAEVAARGAILRGWEYRSRFELLGLPLIHIRFGGGATNASMAGNDFSPLKAAAKGWIAISDSFAFGLIFAYAGMAVAPISIGACALGLISYGAMAIGGIAVGGFAFGPWATGALAAGWQTFANTAIAWNFADGGEYGVAHDYAVGATANAAEVNTDFVRNLAIANPFFRFCWTYLRPTGFWLLWIWAIPMTISMFTWSTIIARRRRREKLAAIAPL